MRKQYENNISKGVIAEEIAILKHRREARKAKEEKKNNIQYNGQKQKEQDQKFLKMITKKKELIYKNNKPLSYVDSSDSKFAPSHVLLRLGNGASVPPFTQARVIQV